MKMSCRLKVGLAAGTVTMLIASAVASADASDSGGNDAAEPATEISAQSQAVLARLVPYVGLPGVTTSVGLVTAQVTNGIARSSAAAADFGLIGTLAASGAEGQASEIPGAPEVTLPAPISADSSGATEVERDPFAAAGGPTAPAGTPGFVAHETATATPDPLAARGSVRGPTLAVPGLLEATGGTSEAGSTAEGASSVVTLDSLALGAGEVVLRGLRWTAAESPATDATSGFTLRNLTVAGQELPVDSPAELAEGLATANTALEPLGLAIEAPTISGDPAAAGVAPLVIQVRVPEPLVDPSRQVSNGIAPLMTEIANALIAANPDAATAQIVANALVGATGGRSGGRIELGGVSARSSLVEIGDTVGSVLGALPDTAPTGGSPASTPFVPAPVDLTPLAGPDAASSGPVPTEAASAPTTGATDLVQAAPTGGSGDDSDRGLAGLALGIALAALLALAVVDRVRVAAAAG